MKSSCGASTCLGTGWASGSHHAKTFFTSAGSAAVRSTVGAQVYRLGDHSRGALWHLRAIALTLAYDENKVSMIAKVLFLGGAVVVGLVCIGLVISTLLYVVYCVVAPHLQKRRA